MTPALLLLFALSVPPSAQQSSAKPAVEQKEPSAPAALSELEALTKRNPDDPKGWVLLGLAYLDRNDYPRALDAFQHAVKVGPRIRRGAQLAGCGAGGEGRPASGHRRVQESRLAGPEVRARLLEPGLDARAERRLRRSGKGIPAGAGAGAEQSGRAPEPRDWRSGRRVISRARWSTCAGWRTPIRERIACSTSSGRRCAER